LKSLRWDLAKSFMRGPEKVERGTQAARNVAGAKAFAEKLRWGNAKLAGAEARAHFAAIAARLKSCPGYKAPKVCAPGEFFRSL
jgi:hypothetical protein